MACNLRTEEYLNGTYEDQIEDYVESNAELDISDEEATELFVDQCEMFEELFKNDCPLAAVRRQAFTQMKWRLENGT